MKLILGFALLLSVSWMAAQLPMGGVTASAGLPALALGAHSSTTNGGTTATTVVVNLTPQAAGSTIVCSFAFSNSSVFTSVTDNQNSGAYLPGASNLREVNHNYIGGIYYHENVAAAATAITLTYSPTATEGKMACAEIKNTPTAYAFDSNVIASQAATGANPNSGTSITPTINGEFVYAGLLSDGITNTAGTNYTTLDPITSTSSAQLIPEYWIQTTKTSTNGPFTNATSRNYGALMAAFAPQQSGTCGTAAVVTWGGGTAGNNPATSDLNASGYGNVSQPNADRAPELAYGSFLPGNWRNVTTANQIVYSTNAYAPFVNTVTCPFYTGTGTNAGTIGLDQPTSNTGNGGMTWTFDTTSNVTTAWTCMSTTAPSGTNGTTDVLTISRGDNSDYANIQWTVSGAGAIWSLEAKSGGTINGTTHWTTNTWYGFLLTYNGGTSQNHSLKIYSYSGSKCTGTPTLQETITSAGAGVGPANELGILGTLANSYATGSHFYMGALKLDYRHGAAMTE